MACGCLCTHLAAVFSSPDKGRDELIYQSGVKQVQEQSGYHIQKGVLL